MRVELLGGAAAVLDDGRVIELRPTMRDQALAYLAWSDDWVSRDRLGFLFWADLPDATVRHNVRQLLKRIRQLEWLDDFDVTGERVRWHVETDTANLLRGDPAHWDELSVGGELLTGFERNATVEYEEWLLTERRRVASEQRSARLAAAAAAVNAGAPDRALGLLKPVLTGDDDGMLLVRYLEIAVDADRCDEAIVAFTEVSRRLRDELGAEPPKRAVELADQARDPIGRSPPPPRRSIIGRQRELTEICRLLERPACRLLTLLGPGGIGKSALARELLAGSGPGRWQRSAFVALESVSDPDLIPTRIASGCGIRLDARLDPLDQVVDALHGYRSLLAVDNAEHLPGGWHVLSALLERCPDLTIVVTSRVRLRLTDEWVYEIGGLADDEAVELLIDRAGRLAPGLAVDPDEALALCHHVGSSPLGIELAVPWLRVMPLAAIVDMIIADVSAMSARAADSPARHHSVEAAMAHSWTLAEPVERAAVEALSVFAAPYTLELATAVADVPPLTVRDLVDTSLVHRRADGLLMSHPLVRQYAAARLAADDARRTGVRERHARAVLDSLDDDLARRESLADDALVAWQWAIEHDAIDMLDRSAAAFARVVDQSARHEQGLRMLTAARASMIRAHGDDVPVPAALDHGAAVLLERLGRHADAAVIAQRAATTAAEVNDQRHLVLALVTLGWARKWTDGDPAQHATTRAALPIAEQLGDDQLTIHVHNGLGCSAPTLEECRGHLLAALVLARRNDLPITAAMLLNNLGMVLWALGDAVAARNRIGEALELARANTDVAWTTATLHNLAFVHAQGDELTTARALIDEAEQLVTDDGQLDPLVLRLVISGEIHRATGDHAAAHERALEALRLARAVGNRAYVLRALRLHGLLLLDHGHDELALHTLAAVLPHTDRRGDFTSEIINPRIRADLTTRFDADELERAARWAERHDLDDVVDLVTSAVPSPKRNM